MIPPPLYLLHSLADQQSYTPTVGERSKYVAELMRQDVIRFTASVRPLLLTAGYFEETIDLWTERVQDELKNLRRRLYIRVSFIAMPPTTMHSSLC